MALFDEHDTYHELHHMVSNFYFVAKKVDEKIDDLMVHVITKQKQHYFHDQLKALAHEIYNLKENQQVLKRDFTAMIMKFCQLLGEQDCEDYTYLEALQGQVLKFVPERGLKTEEEIKLAMQEIKRWSEKEVEFIKERMKLALRFVRAFPCEKGYFKKDIDVILYNTKDYEINVDMVPLKTNGTWSWHNLEGVEVSDDLVEWSLTKVMMKMYGFKLDKAKKEEEVIRHMKAALFYASKNHRDFTKRNLINEVLRQKKNKLAALVQSIIAIKKSSEFDEEVEEANKLMLEWLYQIEREIFFLVNDLVFLVSTCNNQVVVAEYRRELRWKFEGLKRRKYGKVPVVVYRILALLEGDLMEDRGVLFKEIHIRYFMDQLYKMILLLTSVLNAKSSVLSLGMSTKEVLLESVEIVRRCDEEWRAIRMEVDKSIGLA